MQRVPGEFRYWENIDTPGARWLRRGLRLVFRCDPTLSKQAIDDYAASYYDADPVAEAFVEEVYRARGQDHGRRMIERALAHGVDAVEGAPVSLRRLFAEIEERPQWLDERKLCLGARVFRRWGTHLYSFAGAITLQGYLENSVAKPLAFTGAYTGESANRRFLETASFWIDVSEPGALDRGGQGIATALRVRIMHVFVRAGLLEHPEWDLAAWGVPISQGDALLTLMGGSFLPGYLLRLLGYRTSREEIEATMHFWRYVGHLIGVQPRWYPADVTEALGLMFTSHVKGVHLGGEDGRQLAHSYLASYAPTESDSGKGAWGKRLDYRLQLGYVNFFLPPGTRKAYGLPGAGVWGLHPLLQFPWIFARETARRHLPGVDAWVDRRARTKAKAWVRARLGPRTAEYRAVDAFTR